MAVRPAAARRRLAADLRICLRRTYCYAAGGDEAAFRLLIARGDKYKTSDWWTPHSRDVPTTLYVRYRQPLPAGVDPLTHARNICPPASGRPAKPPEKVYEPGGVDVRLTPVPRDLLRAMAGGAVLREATMMSTSWTLTRPGADPEKFRDRCIDALRQVAFERDGVLPPGYLARIHRFDWKIGPAGAAWLTANAGRAVKLTPAPLHLLVAMSRGVLLHECLKDVYFSMQRRPSREFERIHTRAVNDLRRRGLIERSDDPLDRRVSAAGRAWLATNGLAADLENLT